MKITALIVAAGAGARIGAGVPKAFLELGGRPLVEHALAAFDAHARVDAIVLVAPPPRLLEARRLAERFRKAAAVVPGGPRRQDSVRLGLSRAAAEPVGGEDLVLVHDAARPLVDGALITAVIESAAAHGAAVPGLPPAETVRRAGPSTGAAGERVSAGLLDRSELVMVQTPQGFRLSLLVEAFDRAGDADVTDDAALVERLGHPVFLVAGSPANLKVTAPTDIDLAEALLRRARAADLRRI